jgi:hypothetical protein
MTRGFRWSLVSSVVLVALTALAGCSHYWLAEREPWRHDAEIACLNSGAVKESPARVRISAINGPGMCGADYPLRISAVGESGPLGYTDEPVIPSGSIPDAAMPQRWPGTPSYATPPGTIQPNSVQLSTLPPPQNTAPQSYPVPQPYPPPPYSLPTAQVGPPLSLDPPGLPPTGDNDDDIGIPGGPLHPYYGGPGVPLYSARPAPPASAPPPPLGPPPPPFPPPLAGEGPLMFPPPLAGEGREGVASAGPVEMKPAATLACPIVSALDQWITAAVQPAALHWFRQPVVEIKQISAYSCRGMNGNPHAHISEHAFGNALDIAEFTLADGHKISVQYGWHGTPEEQGFLHDVQLAACEEFTTVLAPGANVYHYNHIHVDLMRRSNGRHICEPTAIPGEVVAERARARYAARHGDPGVTGSIAATAHRPALGYLGEDDDSLPLAVPGED